MNNKMRFLSLLVMLTFTVGQVQYAYSSYFCTMKHETFDSVAPSALSHVESCDAAAMMTPSRGPQITNAGCMRIHLAQKKVVDNFSAPDKAPSHVVAIAAILPAGLFKNERPTSVAIAVLPFASPPPDIPTLNSNLRI